MRKLITGLVVVGVLVGGGVAAVSAAGGSDRAPSGAELEYRRKGSADLERAMKRLEAVRGRADRAKVKCTTLRCINRTLTRHDNQVAALNAAVSELFFQFFECEVILPVNQFGDPGGSFGYLFDNNDGFGVFLTSGLDVTSPNDPSAAWVVVYTC